jgi:hypothetical protein
MMEALAPVGPQALQDRPVVVARVAPLAQVALVVLA